MQSFGIFYLEAIYLFYKNEQDTQDTQDQDIAVLRSWLSWVSCYFMRLSLENLRRPKRLCTRVPDPHPKKRPLQAY